MLQAYERQYEDAEPACREVLEKHGRMALIEISRGDALYHDVHHTAIVTLVGQAILEGRQLDGEPVPPRDWLHFLLALLIHDIGFVGGVCRDDRRGVRATGVDGRTFTPPSGATDACLAPYHVDRSRLYARERFAGHAVVDPEILAAHVERTRFPVPEGDEYRCTSDLPGLVRAADLIGQLADPSRDRRLPALFYEFEEVGLNAKLGYESPQDIRADYPRFFRRAVAPHIRPAVAHLRATEQGRGWMERLVTSFPDAAKGEEIL